MLFRWLIVYIIHIELKVLCHLPLISSLNDMNFSVQFWFCIILLTNLCSRIIFEFFARISFLWMKWANSNITRIIFLHAIEHSQFWIRTYLVCDIILDWNSGEDFVSSKFQMFHNLIPSWITSIRLWRFDLSKLDQPPFDYLISTFSMKWIISNETINKTKANWKWITIVSILKVF